MTDPIAEAHQIDKLLNSLDAQKRQALESASPEALSLLEARHVARAELQQAELFQADEELSG